MVQGRPRADSCSVEGIVHPFLENDHDNHGFHAILRPNLFY